MTFIQTVLVWLAFNAVALRISLWLIEDGGRNPFPWSDFRHMPKSAVVFAFTVLCAAGFPTVLLGWALWELARHSTVMAYYRVTRAYRRWRLRRLMFRVFGPASGERLWKSTEDILDRIRADAEEDADA